MKANGDTAFTPYYLHSGGSANTPAGDGTLSTEAPGDEPADSYHVFHDREHPSHLVLPIIDRT